MKAALSPSHHLSSSLEKVLEHRLLADLLSTLWLGGVRDFEVLRGEVDRHGYDLVLEAGGIFRHIQLKAMVTGGKRATVEISAALARKPSGCVIWMVYDPVTLELGPFLWFGGHPGESLPPLGDRLARHTKGNATGIKAERPGHRLLPRSRFTIVSDIAELATLLFGAAAGARRELEYAEQTALLKRYLAAAEPPQQKGWLADVRAGRFESIPATLKWSNSIELAHLIDGYEMVKHAGWGDPFRFADDSLERAKAENRWTGGPAELWALLFLEHRRWRMSPMEPGEETTGLLNRLCMQLRTSLLSERSAEPAN